MQLVVERLEGRIPAGIKPAIFSAGRLSRRFLYPLACPKRPFEGPKPAGSCNKYLFVAGVWRRDYLTFPFQYDKMAPIGENTPVFTTKNCLAFSNPKLYQAISTSGNRSLLRCPPESRPCFVVPLGAPPEQKQGPIGENQLYIDQARHPSRQPEENRPRFKRGLLRGRIPQVRE